MPYNPCINCGACCSFYRVSFYWREAERLEQGPWAVPKEYTEDAGSIHRSMRVEDCKSMRCIALDGTVGRKVACRIYESRPSTCRNFDYSYANGKHNPNCDKARASFGLEPLGPVAALDGSIPSEDEERPR